MTGRSRATRAALLAVPVAFLAVFFAWPVAAILSRGLRPAGHLDLGALRDVMNDGRLRAVAWFTVWQALLSTVLTLVLALPGAWALGRVRFRGRALLQALVVVPFVLPTVVVGSAFLALLGPGGPLGGLGLTGTVWPILLAHVFFNYAVVARTVGGVWAGLDPRPTDAATVLGASRLRAFREITLPALRPAIVSAAAIVFLFCFTSFGVVLLLGGPTRSTIETEIYRQTAQLLDLRTAAALSVVQLLAVVAALVVAGRLEGPTGAAPLALRPDAGRPPRTWGERLALAATVLSMLTLLGLPLLELLRRSFDVGHGWGLAWYRGLLRPDDALLGVAPIVAVRTSLLNALIATVVATIVGGAAAIAIADRRRGAWARAVDGFLMLPLGISAVTVGFGFLITLDAPPLDLRTSPWLVPLAHAVVAIPFVVRATVPVLATIDPHLREAAATLGAPPRTVWREVDLPIVRRALAVAAGFAAAISLGEFGATAFLARPDAPTLPVLVYRLLGRPGAQPFGEAMAASVVLMVLTTVVVLAIDRVHMPSGSRA